MGIACPLFFEIKNGHRLASVSEVKVGMTWITSRQKHLGEACDSNSVPDVLAPGDLCAHGSVIEWWSLRYLGCLSATYMSMASGNLCWTGSINKK